MHDLIEALAAGTMSKDEREGRYYGFVYGVVKEVESDGLGRVKAKLFGFEGDDVTDWLVPFWPGSTESLPEKDDAIIVGFVDGDASRGFYGWHPQRKTKKRATEPAVLGLAAMGLYNHLVTQFNQLRSDVQTLVTFINTLSLTETGGSTVPLTPATGPFPPTGNIGGSDAAKAQAADGAEVAAKSSATKALSKHVKFRGND